MAEQPWELPTPQEKAGFAFIPSALWGASLKGQLFIYVVSLPYLTPKSVFFSPRDALCSEVEHGYEYIDA